ncbi:MAG: hypothetical protein IKD18_01915 [Clostridia bacterium]|nr:hypothetical protein [Clostridia bacterium]
MQPRFGETDFAFHNTNRSNTVLTLQNADKDAFLRYRASFLEEGFEEKEAYEAPHGAFCALLREKTGVFLHWFSRTEELTVVTEENYAYFEREEKPLPFVTTPQITQLPLTDFGLSYAVRLSDGRFIVFDGGWDDPIDRKTLYDCLTEQSEGRTPRIACWILTHPHCDHNRCFNGFWDDYFGKVEIDSVLFHFPEPDDFEHYPNLRVPHRGADNTDSVHIIKNYENIRKIGATHYTAHAGQTYTFGDAKMQILSCMENTIPASGNINAISTVIKMELGGQVILWTGDAYCKPACLAERYGEELKADILQVFHHGFSSGKAAPVIDAYEQIRARTCFISTTEYLVFSAFCIHQEATRHLFDMEGTLEVITGEIPHTIALPYEPKEGSRTILKERIARGLALCGKKEWEFSPVAGKAYVLKNITYSEATVTVTSTLSSGETCEETLTLPKRSDTPFTAVENATFVLMQSDFPFILEETKEV